MSKRHKKMKLFLSSEEPMAFVEIAPRLRGRERGKARGRTQKAAYYDD